VKTGLSGGDGFSQQRTREMDAHTRMHSDFIVFADESGDHSLAKINPVYPVFVLSFCIVAKTDYIETICPLAADC
jgi:hypothetical protein